MSTHTADPWHTTRTPTQLALLEAAVAWQFNGGDSKFSDWLRARAWGCTCGDPQVCRACGAQLCGACGVGEPSRCDHGNGPFCVGCDVDACAGCAHELLPAAGLQSASWRDR